MPRTCSLASGSRPPVPAHRASGAVFLSFVFALQHCCRRRGWSRLARCCNRRHHRRSDWWSRAHHHPSCCCRLCRCHHHGRRRLQGHLLSHPRPRRLHRNTQTRQQGAGFPRGRSRQGGSRPPVPAHRASGAVFLSFVFALQHCCCRRGWFHPAGLRHELGLLSMFLLFARLDSALHCPDLLRPRAAGRPPVHCAAQLGPAPKDSPRPRG